MQLQQLQTELENIGNLIIAQAEANHRYGNIVNHDEIMDELFEKRRQLRQQIYALKYPQFASYRPDHSYIKAELERLAQEETEERQKKKPIDVGPPDKCPQHMIDLFRAVNIMLTRDTSHIKPNALRLIK